MPTEPERDIEKTLRAYANKRREDAGAPGELHPATRRLLQGEVSRLRTNKAGAKSSIWTRLFGGTWPQVALNVCVLLVVIAALAALLLPTLARSKMRSRRMLAEVSQKEMTNRDKDRALGLNPGSPPAESPVPAQTAGTELKTKSAAKQTDVPAASAPAADSNLALNESAGYPAEKSAANGQPGTTHSLALDDRKKDNLLATTESAKEPVPPVALTSPAPANTFDGTSNFKKSEQEEIAQRLAKAAPVVPQQAAAAAPTPASAPADQENFGYRITNAAPPPAPATVTFADSGALTDNLRRYSADSSKLYTGVIAQKFARAGQPTNLSRRMRSINKVVLQSFRVEQAGNQIRIIDGDGSIYGGVLQSTRAREEAVASEGRVMTIGRGGSIPAGEDLVTNSVTLGPANLGGAFSPVLLQYFSVSGTNRSLRLPIVFSGNLVPQFSNGIAGKPSTNTRQTGSLSASSAASPDVSPLLYFQLQGQATVGGSNQIYIKAVPTKK